MTNERLKTILYKLVKSHPVLKLIPEIKKDETKPVTRESARERIAIVVQGLKNGQFERTFASVNVYVPDEQITDGITYDAPNNKRLEVLEEACRELFKSSLWIEGCLFTREHILTEEDKGTFSHFLNVRLLIEVPNFNL